MSSGSADALDGDLGGGRGLEVLEAHADALGGGGGHVGDDEAGGDGVGGDAELAEFDGEGLGEALQTGLGRRVVDLAAVAERRAGGEVDDPAELGVDHVLLAGPGHQERAAQVHVHDRVPVGVAHLEQQVVAEHTGVVDQDGRRAELGGDPGDRRLHLRRVGDVAADGDGLAAGLGDLLDGVLAGRLVEVEYGDGAALGGQAYGGGRADTAGRARHDGDALLGGGHAGSPHPRNLDKRSAAPIP